MNVFQPKPRTCNQCESLFTPVRAMQRVCSPICASRMVRAQKAKEKVALKARKAAVQTIPELIKLAQVAFNAYIRERDRDELCICCNQPLKSGDVGGAYDCGHYRSTGSASHLRFDERNAHAQRKVCNRWGAGRAVDYRLGLCVRIGVVQVQELEANNAPRKWTHDELREIRATYQAKLKALKKEQE